MILHRAVCYGAEVDADVDYVFCGILILMQMLARLLLSAVVAVHGDGDAPLVVGV